MDAFDATITVTIPVQVRLKVRIDPNLETHEVLRAAPVPKTLDDWLRLVEVEAEVDVDEKVAAEIEKRGDGEPTDDD